LTNSGKGQGAHFRVFIFLLVRGATEAISLLAPHQGNFAAIQGSEQGSGMENADIVVGLKGPDHLEFALVDGMGALGPIMGHVNEADALKAHEVPVIGASEFTLGNSADCAGLANKSAPALTDGRELEAEGALATAGKGRAYFDATDVIGSLARECPAGVVELETCEQKTTTKDVTIRGQAEATVHASVRLVPSASKPRGARKGGPACFWWA
jgi:hypothetical protein